MGKYIDYKTYNPIYAPGIGTYSSKGETGDKGDTGTSIYMNNASIKRNTSEKLNVEDKINRNVLLSPETDEETNERGYQYGDLVIDSDGDVYMICGESSSYRLSEKPIGNISSTIKKDYYIETVDSSTYYIRSDSSLNYRYNVTLDDNNNSIIYGCQKDASFNKKIKQVEVYSEDTGSTAIFLENL